MRNYGLCAAFVIDTGLCKKSCVGLLCGSVRNSIE